MKETDLFVLFQNPIRNVAVSMKFFLFFTDRVSVHGTQKKLKMMSWNCAFCVFSTILLHLLLTHINTRHNDQSNFFVFCGIDGCDQRFQKAKTFARHVREKHRLCLYSNRQEVDMQTLENETGKYSFIMYVWNSVDRIIISGRDLAGSHNISQT